MRRRNIHKQIALLFLGAFSLALMYPGLHQYGNYSEAKGEECGLVDFHLHKNSQKHSCELCDYQLQVQLVANEFLRVEKQIIPLFLDDIPEPPCLEGFNLPSLRGPPNS